MPVQKRKAAVFALLAAALYAINIPVCKLLLQKVQPGMLAAFLYLGAGVGLFVYGLFSRPGEGERLTRKELPYTLAMILLDIAAPILLMVGLQRTNPANAALLNNFEIVATTAIAFFLFRERVSVRLFWAILLVTAASILLSFEGWESLRFEKGAFFVLGACLCWGLENNCTRKLSGKSSVQITTVKGIFSGLGGLTVAFLMQERLPALRWLLVVMALGFVSYGLSIHFYIRAQKHLGAARTSAYYSVAPFIGAALSMLTGQLPGWQFYAGLTLMIAATGLMIREDMRKEE